MKPRLLTGIVVGLAAIVVAVATSRADPELPNVPAHRHYIKTATGELVEVGPRVCDDPSLQRAFNQFHNNIHIATGSSIGPAAPGLHNFKGADISAGGCDSHP
jgi:hypothetical protein